MNSTEAGIKRFVEHYGEITPETIREFLGLSKRSSAFEKIKKDWNDRIKLNKE